ncbi:MAG: hypothetical protein JRH16_00785 [Deltaproteobacteria bacterium]|nr:hypothetical protein [Deltaproteobacteria bacterium]MBW2360864.1 hypothetical protein [Deltaproteobacteria bacterium]
MSTILKALRRLEDDRSIHEQRPLRETVTAAGDVAKPSPRRGRWLVGLALLLGAGAAVLAFWSVADTEPVLLATAPAPPAVAPPLAASPPAEPVGVAEAETTAPGVDVDSEASAALVSRLEPPLEPPRELPDAALASRVERLERPPAGPRIDDVPTVAPVEPDAGVPHRVRGQPLLDPGQLPGRRTQGPGGAELALAEPRPPSQSTTAVQPAVERVDRAPPTQPKSQPVAPPAESAPAPAVAERTEPAPPPVTDERPSSVSVSRSETAPAPAASETSAAPPPAASTARAAVPVLLVARTSWHPTALRRSATVQLDAGEALEVHEGDAVGPLVVSRIEPSSVVFLHEGVEIRRRVGQH